MIKLKKSEARGFIERIMQEKAGKNKFLGEEKRRFQMAKKQTTQEKISVPPQALGTKIPRTTNKIEFEGSGVQCQ